MPSPDALPPEVVEAERERAREIFADPQFMHFPVTAICKGLARRAQEARREQVANLEVALQAHARVCEEAARLRSILSRVTAKFIMKEKLTLDDFRYAEEEQ